MFVSEMCQLDENTQIERTKLYTSYKIWCKINGMHPKSAQKFYAEMDAHAKQKIIRGVRLYQGIQFNNLSTITLL